MVSIVFSLSFPDTHCGRSRMMLRWPATTSHCHRRCLKKTSLKRFLMVHSSGTSWSPEIQRSHLVASVNLPTERRVKIKFPQRCERRCGWMAVCSMHYFVWLWSWGVSREAWTVGSCQTPKTQDVLPVVSIGTSNLDQGLVRFRWLSLIFIDFQWCSLICLRNIWVGLVLRYT